MDDALILAGVAHETDIGDGEIVVLPNEGVTIDRIGPIPAIVDDEGVVIKAGDARYHANIRVSVPLTKEQEDALPTFDPLPTIPYRVFI